MEIRKIRPLAWTGTDVTQWLRSLLQPEPLVEHAADALAELRLQPVVQDEPGTFELDGQRWSFDSEVGVPTGVRRMTLVITELLCFRRLSQLPRASVARASDIMDVEFSGLSPIGRDRFIGGSHLHAAASKADSIVCEQILIKRGTVSTLLETASGMGFRVSALAFAGPSGDLQPLILDPDGAPYGSRRLQHWAWIALASVVVATVAFALFAVTVASQEDDMFSQLLLQRQALETKAKDLRQQLAAQKRASARVTAILAGETHNGLVLGALDETARLLPDEAYLQLLVVDGNSLTIDGLAEGPDTLISKFEASPFFASASFLSPAYRDPASRRSHFTLKADIETDGAARP